MDLTPDRGRERGDHAPTHGMLDWTTVGMAEARAAERKRLAGAAMARISSHRPAGRLTLCKFRRQIKYLKIGWQEWRGPNSQPPVLEYERRLPKVSRGFLSPLIFQTLSRRALVLRCRWPASAAAKNRGDHAYNHKISEYLPQS